ncbi:MAG: bifunctional [glutamate--ammonia ligase]-adenylyl-L-tyrosine phosphorylase/[glutamate--ammonia-ligase] adenylyltransferase, partial [Gammaproteobacteria bacterium]|nr:bifunctional [glutamate--ammonia ligase]-adenylyl-L-tyrosine phosphorylase/[glutamate--ammonia-ligase] adenylyltransferase [Gammaproteobacteria bacterium]
MHEQTIRALQAWQQWQAEYLPDTVLDESIQAKGPRVLEYSEFVVTEINRNPEIFQCLLETDVLGKTFSPSISPTAFKPDLTGDERDFMVALRRFRKLHMLWIYWRDLSDDADLEETFAHISWLADECLNMALSWAHSFSCQRFSIAPESLSPLLIMAMGKYGAEELNVSSDIDLIFCYDDSQPLTGRLRALELFYTQVGRKLIQLLDQRTADGFVFRVDMRLRPYGDSGPLVMSQSAMESYYLEQGRDWERFAMIKARFVTGDETQIDELYGILKPFVYRRYVDFSVLEAPRKMKRLIESEVRRRNLGTNIKLGAGGIREVEFFAQALQLIHGGREPRLQSRELLATLKVIAELDLVAVDSALHLEEAYRFLRKLEHRLQAYKDEQTQILPDSDTDCERLARSMGFDTWTECESAIQFHREHVNCIFADLFATEEATASNTDLQYEDFWLADDGAYDFAVLAPLGEEQSKAFANHLQHFKTESSIRNMGPRGSKVLDELMPKV